MTADSPDTPASARDLARQLLQESDKGMPVWVRAPIDGQEHFTGLTRAKLYELAGKGHIRSVSLRDPGRVKGCRLFHLQSMLDYIERIEAQAGEQDV
jgi:hypothetical protein